MKKKNLKPVKAMFLLIVFCMSTLVSFACAMGVEMGYNENHHQDKVVKASSSHHHDDSHEHSDNKTHKHSKSVDTQSEKKADDDCCKKEAKKFAQFDKIVSKVSADNNQQILLVAFVQTFYSFDLLKSNDLVSVKRNLYRGHHPPIPDRRIAIQSFLI